MVLPNPWPTPVAWLASTPVHSTVPPRPARASPAWSGFYIITYALGIYNLNLLLGFLTPQVDPELEGPTLPSKKEDEFRPFVRRLPEFKFWYG